MYAVFGRPFIKRFALCYRTVVLSVCPVYNVGALWPNGWMDQDETWHADRPRPWPHCVRWGPSSPSPKGDKAPNFSAHMLWPNGWMDQDATWQGDRPQPKRYCVIWRPISSSPKGGGVPQFSAHICCGQMTGWIKMPLGREVGLSQSDIVLDGDQLPPKRCMPPVFGPCLLWPTAGWMKMPLGTEIDLSPGHIVLDGDPAAPSPGERGTAAPSFRPMSIVATVAHLSYC